jgi:hypothetical protein
MGALATIPVTVIVVGLVGREDVAQPASTQRQIDMNQQAQSLDIALPLFEMRCYFFSRDMQTHFP